MCEKPALLKPAMVLSDSGSCANSRAGHDTDACAGASSTTRRTSSSSALCSSSFRPRTVRRDGFFFLPGRGMSPAAQPPRTCCYELFSRSPARTASLWSRPVGSSLPWRSKSNASAAQVWIRQQCSPGAATSGLLRARHTNSPACQRRSSREPGRGGGRSRRCPKNSPRIALYHHVYHQ